jgi:hypothetical protein
VEIPAVERCIDKEPEFLFVPAPRVLAVAIQTGAVPYDVPDVELTHFGPNGARACDNATCRVEIVAPDADEDRGYDF